MSIVSPIVACGAVVPFAISIATGERPSALALAGAVIALTGAVLASPRSGARRRPTARGRSRSRSSPRSRSASSPTSSASAAARASALSTLVGARDRLARAPARARRSRAASRSASAGAGSCRSPAVGLCDVAANALFALASGRGLLVARLRARLALPGDDGPARLRRPPRAADARPGRRRSAIALAGVAALSAG